MMQTVVDYSAALVAAALVLERLRAVLRTRGDRQAVWVWLFTASVVPFVVFQIDDVYTTVDRLVGAHNLAWLLSYVFMVLAAYYLCHTFIETMPGWSGPGGVITIVTLAAIYPFGPARAAETTDHVHAANVGEILFMGVNYLYFVAMVSLIPIPLCLRTLRARQQPTPDRLRTLVILPALAVTVSNALTKLVVYSAGFVLPTLPAALLNTVTDVSRLQAGAVTVLWVASLAPSRLYRGLAHFVEFLQKVHTCRELGRLQDWLDAAFPAVASDRAAGLDVLKAPDLHLYRRTIHILDRQKMLAQAEDGPAARLYQGLQNIPASASFDQVVAACRDLSRQIGKTR